MSVGIIVDLGFKLNSTLDAGIHINVICCKASKIKFYKYNFRVWDTRTSVTLVSLKWYKEIFLFLCWIYTTYTLSIKTLFPNLLIWIPLLDEEIFLGSIYYFFWYCFLYNYLVNEPFNKIMSFANVDASRLC